MADGALSGAVSGAIAAGDVLVLVNGEYVVVEKVQHEILEAPVTVYNFQVEDFHTYFVTESAVLVHNACVNPDDILILQRILQTTEVILKK